MLPYALGVIVLAAILVPPAWAAVGVRRALLPGWSGAPAVMVDMLIWVALATAVPEIVGAVGGFRRLQLIVAVVAVSVGCRALVRSGPREVPASHPTPRRPLVVATVAALAGPWIAYIAQAYRYGSQSFDTLNYHLPFAARWVLTGSTWHLQNVFPGIGAPSFIVPYHPLQAEVLHAVGMLSLHRDLLTPLLNLFWLGLVGVAAWAIGAPKGRGPHCLALGMVAANCPLLIASQPGTAMTDLALVALCLAAVALLVQGVSVRSIAIPLGVTLGLAAGVKLNALPFVAVVAVIALIQADRRVRTAVAVVIPALLVGGFWYVRDFAAVGSPLPSLDSSVGAHSAHVDAFSVVRYLNDWTVLRHWYAPALRVDFGSWWPLWLLAALAGVILAPWRWAAIVTVVTVVAYAVTPTTAFGPPGQPSLFLLDVRYAMPAVALGVVLLGAAPRFRYGDWLAALGAVAVLVSPVTWPLPPHPGLSWRVIGMVISVVAVLAALLITHPPARTLTVGAVLLVGLGYVAQRTWVPRQYQDAAPALAWGWQIHNARIAFVGLSANYPLSGVDLNNYVQYLGVIGPHHAFDNPPDCAAFRMSVNTGRYDYVVFANASPTAAFPGEDVWLRGAAGAVPVLTTHSATAYRVTHLLDPATCPRGG